MCVEDCIFCKIVAGVIPATKIYEDELAIAFLDINPVSDGHTLVISKQHFEKLHDCPSEILAGIVSCLGTIGKAVSEAVGADGYNVLNNNGKAAGQLVNHLHFHIVPRYINDGVFDRWPCYNYKDGVAEGIADNIRLKLQ